MESLLKVQALDLKIEKCKEREAEIPKQKKKYEVQRKRLDAELAESEERLKRLQLEQRECEGDIEAKGQQIAKYQTQLNAVKKNEEYQALLHEIEGVKKLIAQREERIIAIMMELDEAKAKVAEDRKRIDAERKSIDAECATIDAELAEAVKQRKELEEKRKPLMAAVPDIELRQYDRIRKNKGGGAAVVPLLKESICGGCHMSLTPQVINQILGGQTVPCRNCGRIVYNGDTYDLDSMEAGA